MLSESLFFFLNFFSLNFQGDKVANGGKSSAAKDPHQFEHRVDQGWCLHMLSLYYFLFL